ncbi:hypothetical protein [Rhizobium leguminosarum]|uniref:hypothetical protein n=1 Tax=Rhizobium leguminosarum TaxID=384 RepID=UPI001C9598BE|nr:hypothetical protein [Rhizobium leguminosarum]MBY5427876.1 hypothetical protein [Rhizobium leguminosarum]MBY5530908.1 hypothetical protein [Rhizobium leguminosarum]
MIFARRALQRRLRELRAKIGDSAVDGIVARLNLPGRDRIAAMWEVVVLHGLAACGDLASEQPLPSGRRPDAWFDNGHLRFIADVTTASDEGLDKQNPYSRLSEIIERAKGKLGLPIGGVNVQVYSRAHESSRGKRTFLKLPPIGKLETFVKDDLMPRFREQLDAGEAVLRVSIDDDLLGLDIEIDPSKSPYSSVGFTTYDIPTIKDRNPLYSALKEKAEQLQGANGITGVILGDGDCAALAERKASSRYVSADAIAREMLRQYSSVNFVLLLTIREERRHYFPPSNPIRHVHPILVYREGDSRGAELEALFGAMLQQFPSPVMMPKNGALRAREEGYDTGQHGAYQLVGRKIRMSSRELIEVLAGLRTLDDNGARNVKASRSLPSRPNSTKQAFLRKLRDGRLPVRINVDKTGENDNDDWIEFDFGEADSAIAPFE